jgi:hypothetical protein
MSRTEEGKYPLNRNRDLHRCDCTGKVDAVSTFDIGFKFASPAKGVSQVLDRSWTQMDQGV